MMNERKDGESFEGIKKTPTRSKKVFVI